MSGPTIWKHRTSRERFYTWLSYFGVGELEADDVRNAAKWMMFEAGSRLDKEPTEEEMRAITMIIATKTNVEATLWEYLVGIGVFAPKGGQE